MDQSHIESIKSTVKPDSMLQMSNIDLMQQEVVILKKIEKLFKPRKNKNWYFIKMQRIQKQKEALNYQMTIDQSIHNIKMNQSIESSVPKIVPEAMTEDMENDEDELFDENLMNQSTEQLKDARYQPEDDDVPRFGGVVENTD